MRAVLCTLFSFGYLDKGLALFESLSKVSRDFVLYVLAMDDDGYDFLRDVSDERLVPIRLSDFEDAELLEAKQNRSFGEYCWTCSSPLIRYVLDTYQEPWCAYIDADMFFYADPSVLFDELEERGGSVLLTGHRFSWYEKERAEVVGHFCVEFNLFRNNAAARGVLDKWIAQSLLACSAESGKDSFGDQKYLDGLTEDYDFVLETSHLGAGVAPWNVAQYQLVSHEKGGGYKLICRGREVDLVFYHFAGITYLDRCQADIGVYSYWGIDDHLVRSLYSDYLRVLDRYKQQVEEKTGRQILLKSHPAFSAKKTTLSSRLRSTLSKIKCRAGRKRLLFVDIPKEVYKSRNLFQWE